MNLIGLCVAAAYLVAVGWHFWNPGQNYAFTKVLLFACIGTPAFVFLMLTGGRLRERMRSPTAEPSDDRGVLPTFLISLTFIFVLGWVSLGISLSIIVLGFLFPIGRRLWTATLQELEKEVVGQVVLYFAALLLGLGIALGLQRIAPLMFLAEKNHFDQVWPGYRQGGELFIGICLYAFLNQLKEAKTALFTLKG